MRRIINRLVNFLRLQRILKSSVLSTKRDYFSNTLVFLFFWLHKIINFFFNIHNVVLQLYIVVRKYQAVQHLQFSIRRRRTHLHIFLRGNVHVHTRAHFTAFILGFVSFRYRMFMWQQGELNVQASLHISARYSFRHQY